MNQREKDKLHFRSVGHIESTKDAVFADGAEYGRQQLARRILQALTGEYGEITDTRIEAICREYWP